MSRPIFCGYTRWWRWVIRGRSSIEAGHLPAFTVLFTKLDGYRLGPHKAVSIVVAFRARVPGVYYFGHGATVHADRTGPRRYMPFLGKTFSYTYSGAYETFCVGVPDDACSASTGERQLHQRSYGQSASVRSVVYLHEGCRQLPVETDHNACRLAARHRGYLLPQSATLRQNIPGVSGPAGRTARTDAGTTRGQPGGRGSRVPDTWLSAPRRPTHQEYGRVPLSSRSARRRAAPGNWQHLRFQDSADRLTLADRGWISVFGLT